MSSMLLTILAFAGRVCVGLLFVLAAGQKMRSWTLLTGVISNYRILPRSLVKPAVFLLPPVELALGWMLLSGQASFWGVLLAMALLALFAAAMAINLGRGRTQIDCGCGQSFLSQTLSPALVVRNVILMLLLAPSLALAGGLSVEIALTGVGAGISLFLLYLMANTLIALPKPASALAV
jgi:hypothetical protein